MLFLRFWDEVRKMANYFLLILNLVYSQIKIEHWWHWCYWFKLLKKKICANPLYLCHPCSSCGRWWIIKVTLDMNVIASCNTVIASCNTVIVSCNNVIASSNNVIASSNNVIASCNTVIASCNNVIASCNTVIASCNNVIASCNSAIASYIKIMPFRYLICWKFTTEKRRTRKTHRRY